MMCPGVRSSEAEDKLTVAIAVAVAVAIIVVSVAAPEDNHNTLTVYSYGTIQCDALMHYVKHNSSPVSIKTTISGL